MLEPGMGELLLSQRFLSQNSPHPHRPLGNDAVPLTQSKRGCSGSYTRRHWPRLPHLATSPGSQLTSKQLPD